MKVLPARANSKKKESMTQSLVTPKGTAKYPKLVKPDTKFVPEGVYSVTLELDPDQGAKLADVFENFYNMALENAEKVLGKSLKPAGSSALKVDDVSGKFLLSAKAKASVKSHIPIKDSNRRDTSETVTPGSVIRLGITLGSYIMAGKFGVTVYLNEVMLIDRNEDSFTLFDPEPSSSFSPVDNSSDDVLEDF